jgi:hypothetical protein
MHPLDPQASRDERNRLGTHNFRTLPRHVPSKRTAPQRRPAKRPGGTMGGS